MNILILSSGTRNKIIQYFKKELKGNGLVIATDMSDLSPAIYEADKHYIVPAMTAPGYLDVVLEICQKEKVAGVLSLIDPELSLLAKNKQKIENIGTKVIGSSYELCEMSLDKYQMFCWLVNHGYLCAKSYIDPKLFLRDVEKGKISYPVFAKPVRGSASLDISVISEQVQLEALLAHEDGILIQEYLNGQEIGADVYIDMISREVVSIFTKKKIKMRAGETDKAISFKEKKLFELIEKFVKEAGFVGQIDMDLFEIQGEYYISEVNPRFGGGYPHAYESGANHIRMILKNLAGEVNPISMAMYKSGTRMMKYNEIMVIGQ